MKLSFSILIPHALSAFALVARRQTPAPYITSDLVRHCDNLYIVQLQEGHTLEAHFKTIGVDLSQNTTLFYLMTALNAYHARLDHYTIHELVRHDPGVLSVLHDYYDDGESRSIDGKELEDIQAESPKPGLMRRWYPQTITSAYWYNVMISAGTKLSTPLPEYGDRFLSSQAGARVDIYILDSGINIWHKRFSGRASNFKGMLKSPYTDPEETMVHHPTANAKFTMYFPTSWRIYADFRAKLDIWDNKNRGHGTHVAGIAGADLFGAAPYANIVNVKTHGIYGANAGGVVRAILDIIEVHSTKKAQFPAYPGCVINMSFNLVDLDRLILKALNKAYNAGILATVSAGNVPQSSTGALCRYPVTVCVAATDRNYTAWKWSDNAGSSYGPSVKIWAPGVDITSTSVGGGLEEKTGTSMAAPMVAEKGNDNPKFSIIGVIAGFISHEHLRNDTKTILARLTGNGLSNIINSIPPNTANRFLNNGFGQTRGLDIPYIGAPERGWDVHQPNSVAVGGTKLTSVEVKNDDVLASHLGNWTSNTSWETIFYAESTTVVGMYFAADLSTAVVDPLVSTTDGNDGSFEGDYWDNTTQNITSPAAIDPGNVTSTAALSATTPFTLAIPTIEGGIRLSSVNLWSGPDPTNVASFLIGGPVIIPSLTFTTDSALTAIAEGDTCDVSYRWLYDIVEVRGKSWTTAELGTNGENLKTQLAGCGDLTDWNFELTPNDCCMDWYASARLPIGVKACVGRAVVTAGGPNANVGNCHGAG
ncbi:hypothetical protein OIDMADRAFT_61917 [Oidiodendron maius Zn]|uniref:Peptidase S8/S53 domain-containing protein n=1 Tax=Oidiodendron maius (strain Zn) TaxID=913774 RepID=A0A0C3CTY5_OIDMZ|nr:hypothetical protein OIDMADRAFT_61917 [Oidiodendron maius Zn]